EYYCWLHYSNSYWVF
nr:immunoglobulin light chain junction region [Macaca mulatta]MOW30789.1 immunoglobulin light chain junction region [Macaca mulatta]